MALLGLFALLMLVQLIPMPPSWWLSLPGREPFAEIALAAGVPQPWRPLSLTPDGTWNSLTALSIPFAVLIALAGLTPVLRQRLLTALIVLACCSALLGIAQLAAGDRSVLYLYSITHDTSPVGFFANRNHQAALLAMTFPMLRLWSRLPAKDASSSRARSFIAFGIGLFMIPMILVTGSRAGTLLGAIGLFAAFVLIPGKRREGGTSRFKSLSFRRMSIIGAAIVGTSLVAVSAIVLGRAVALERWSLAFETPETELRVAITPVVWEIIGDFFPFGSGFGSFVPIYRMYEPDALLDVQYVNNAHNDLFELAMTGGLPALLLLLALFAWLARKSIRSLSGKGIENLYGRAATIMIVIALLASLPDYPLRTPLMSAVFTIALGWLVSVREASASRPRRD